MIVLPGLLSVSLAARPEKSIPFHRTMGDAATTFSYPPTPPWRIQLRGEERDLQELVAEHPSGRTRVIHFQGEYFLEADSLNALSDPTRASESAQVILNIICCLAKIRRLSALPVKAASVVWTDENGNWIGRLPLPSVHYRIVLGTRYLEGANVSQQVLALAETDEVVRINLIDFLGERDFSRLRRIARAILMDLGRGDIKSGVNEVVQRGWATPAECAHLVESMNFGNDFYLGAHARQERAFDQNQNPLSLAMTEEFVRQLLARWIDSKIRKANI